MGSHPASGGYKYRGLVLRDGGWAWGYTTLPCKKISRILRRKPRPKLGCEAKERRNGLVIIQLWKENIYIDSNV
jgi:hypothetical protein